MEIIKILILSIAFLVTSNDTDTIVRQYSYATHIITEDGTTWYNDLSNDTIACKKETSIGKVLTQIVRKHDLGDRDIIYTYPDSIGYTIRK
tara:strand:- start:272 stop:544 length:273 start_codon:yes stop_codon:yes gene_type:complete